MWCDEAERSSGFQSEGLVVITLVTLRKKNGLWPVIVGIIQPPFGQYQDLSLCGIGGATS